MANLGHLTFVLRERVSFCSFGRKWSIMTEGDCQRWNGDAKTWKCPRFPASITFTFFYPQYHFHFLLLPPTAPDRYLIPSIHHPHIALSVQNQTWNILRQTNKRQTDTSIACTSIACTSISDTSIADTSITDTSIAHKKTDQDRQEEDLGGET